LQIRAGLVKLSARRFRIGAGAMRYFVLWPGEREGLLSQGWNLCSPAHTEEVKQAAPIIGVRVSLTGAMTANGQKKTIRDIDETYLDLLTRSPWNL
jgi:hypothetical protein